MASRGPGPEPSQPSVNPQLLSAMQTALQHNPLTQELSEEERLTIALRALREGKMQDAVWLEELVLKLRQGESIAAPTPAAAPVAGRPPLEIPVALPQQVTSQEHLEEILDAHAAWIKKVLEPGLELTAGRANLKGSDLRGYVFDGRDLRSANLEGCDLRDCSLIAANLAGANLSKAKLNGARLDRARLRRSNLSAADFSGAFLTNADLRHAQTSGSKWADAELSGTILEKENKSKAPQRPLEAPPAETPELSTP